jgi:hypothetical protein
MTGQVLQCIYWLLSGWWHEDFLGNECGVISTSWKTIYALWTMGVPILFFFHYIRFAEWHPPENKILVEHMKHLQQIGLSFWVAAATILAILYLN